MKKLKEQIVCFLKIAEKHNLCFKRLKCDFNMEEIPILGVVVGRGQVQIETNKVKAVKEWKTPIKWKAFLRLTNFYRQFIKNFNYMVKPLNELKEKKNWKWEEEYQRSFDKLKDKITSQPVLALPKKSKFQVEIDVSEHAIGGVLFQEQEGKWKHIMFLSRTM